MLLVWGSSELLNILTEVLICTNYITTQLHTLRQNLKEDDSDLELVAIIVSFSLAFIQSIVSLCSHSVR